MTSRRSLLLGFLVCLLAGPSAAQDVPRDSPEALLRFIYGHYVGKPAGADIDFEWMSSPLVDALFTAEVAKAVIKETDSEELGGLDFDPFVDGQDFEIKSYELKAESKTADRARITARFKNMGEQKAVRYDLVRGASGWSISDISWGADRDTLRKILKLP
jgi:hypothetical protein